MMADGPGPVSETGGSVGEAATPESGTAVSVGEAATSESGTAGELSAVGVAAWLPHAVAKTAAKTAPAINHFLGCEKIILIILE